MHTQMFRVTSYPGWGKAVELRSLLPLIDESAARTWIHCAIEGTWKGHPNGPFEFTREVFSQICKNLKAQKNSVLPLTYGHPEYSTGEPEPAGYVHDFAIREDGLWALVELFPETANQIRAGKFRFCSVVVRFDSVDRKSGEPVGAEVFEIGLTNSPFIDGLTPIKLSRSAALSAGDRKMAAKETEKKDTDTLIKEAKKRVGEDANPRKFLEVLQALVEFEEKMNGAGGDPEPPKEDAPAAASTVPASRTDDDEAATKLADATVVAAEPTAALNDEAMTLLMQALSMTPQEVVAWLREHAPQLPSIVGAPSETADSAFSREVVEGLVTQLKAATDRIEALESNGKETAKKKEQETAEEKVEALVKNNRLAGLTGTQKAAYVALARKSPAQFDAIVAALPKQAVPTDRITAKPGDAPRALSAHVVKVNGQEVDITPRDENEVALCRMTASTESRAKNLARYRAEQAARSL